MRQGPPAGLTDKSPRQAHLLKIIKTGITETGITGVGTRGRGAGTSEFRDNRNSLKTFPFKIYQKLSMGKFSKVYLA
jgi:hypothetical protein